MPPKKAAKRAPKKTANKHAPKPEGDQSLNNTLRAYEHLGRVRALVSFLAPDAAETVSVLGDMSQASLRLDAAGDAADLLRAAEHYCFATLAIKDPTGSAVSTDLRRSIEMECDHLRERSDTRASVLAPTIHVIYREMCDLAARALSAGSYRAALEMARGAEALSHVESHNTALAQGNATSIVDRQ
jgi:hypothetical protein